MSKKLWLIVPIVILMVFVAGCQKATEPKTEAKTKTGELFMIALPRLELKIDSEGNPSVLGVSPAALKAVGLDLGGLTFPKETVQKMTDAGIQHIELSFVGDGLGILVNGQPVPQLGWSGESLQSAIDLAGVLGLQNAGLYSKLVPIANRLGLDLVLRFPTQPGAAEIPLAEPGAAGNVTLAPTSDPASAIVKMELKYDENGKPTVMGLGAEDMTALGMSMPGTLPPETIAKLQAGNIQNLELRTKPDGMYIYVNGSPLPNLVWDRSMLTYVAKLYGQADPKNPLLEVVNAVLPNLDRLDIGILMHFPPAAGAEAIPAQMH